MAGDRDRPFSAGGLADQDFGRITFTRPTTPLTRRTLMPCGWVGDLVRIAPTIPSVSVPER